MDNITLEQVETLADQLSTEEQQPATTNGKQLHSLRGIWKGAFPEDFDIDAALYEIRHEWEKDWPEVFGKLTVVSSQTGGQSWD